MLEKMDDRLLDVFLVLSSTTFLYLNLICLVMVLGCDSRQTMFYYTWFTTFFKYCIIHSETVKSQQRTSGGCSFHISEFRLILSSATVWYILSHFMPKREIRFQDVITAYKCLIIQRNQVIFSVAIKLDYNGCIFVTHRWNKWS